MDTKFVSYIRVSTDRQHESGLGEEAQRTAITSFLTANGATLLAEYIETESGGKNDRPILAAALADCKARGAVLLVAKLDRLSRSVAFIAGLMERGVRFKATEHPEADPFMLHIYASVAEQERRAISKRTRAALAAARSRGTLMGTRRTNCAGGRALADRMRREGQERIEGMRPRIEALANQGIVTVRAVAAALGISRASAGRLLKRLHSPSDAGQSAEVQGAQGEQQPTTAEA
jgi:DNA invertase Pin-like site-specific DNA recombinase